MRLGSSTRRGGGRKVRALARKLSSLGLEERNLGCSGSFAGMSWTPGNVQKVCAKKFVRIFVPYDRWINQVQQAASVNTPPRHSPDTIRCEIVQGHLGPSCAQDSCEQSSSPFSGQGKTKGQQLKGKIVS